MTGARLVVADDSVLLREGLVGLLERQGFEVVAQEGRADALVQCVRELAAGGALPDAVITDVRMPPGMSNDGLRAALDLKTEFPALGMLVVSQYVAPLYAQELFGLPTPAGAGGRGGLEESSWSARLRRKRSQLAP